MSLADIRSFVAETVGRGRTIAVPGAIAALALLAACDDRQAAEKTPPKPPLVKVAPVEVKNVPIVMEFSGTLKAINRVDVLPRVTGYLTERTFKEGDYVEKDTKLYQIDPRPFQDAVDETRGQLQIDQANVDYTKKEVDRFTTLVQDQAVAQASLDEKTRAYDDALGSLARTQATLASNELDLSFTTITAPFAGKVQQTLVDVGQLVNQSTTKLTTMLQTDPIYVIFNVSSVDYYRIQRLQNQGIASRDPADFKVEVLRSDGSVYQHSGKLDFISAEVDPNTDTMTLRGIMPNPGDGDNEPVLVTGQYVPVRLTIGERKDQLAIPKPALIESQVGQQVYVVGGDNKAVLKTVSIEQPFGDSWIVAKGLEKGEKVIVEGTQKIRDGVEVDASELQQPAGGGSDEAGSG